MNNEPKLHIIVDSREASVSFARHFFERSWIYPLGIVEHIRGSSFAERFALLMEQCLPGDAILISVQYLPENQLKETSSLLQAITNVRVYLAAYECFEHMQQWCLGVGAEFLPNRFKRRKKPQRAKNTDVLQSGGEVLQRIWAQYRLMLAIISRVQKLGTVCRQIIEGLPAEDDTLEIEYARALRFFEQGEPDMAGGSYSCEESEATTPIDTLRLKLNKIAANDFNVLIRGDSGTGKETVAWVIHELSSRRNKPFFVLNCAGLPDELLESEMFGYKKGSHNQAYNDSHGILESADGGTLFLDELPEMSPRIQAKLLRFLESGEYRPLGSTENRYSDIRILAAGQSLRLDGTKSLRSDLISRIGQLDVDLLPLRELEKRSPGTLYKIAFILLERYTWTTIFTGSQVHELTPLDIKRFQDQLAVQENLDLLVMQQWKTSNIRELNNFLRKWIVFGENEMMHLRESRSFSCQENGVKEGGRVVRDEQLEGLLFEPKNREELRRLACKKPLQNLKKSYIRHLFKIYCAIIERENASLDLPKKPTQKELAKIMGVTENTISRHLN